LRIIQGTVLRFPSENDPNAVRLFLFVAAVVLLRPFLKLSDPVGIWLDTGLWSSLYRTRDKLFPELATNKKIEWCEN